MEVSTLSSTFPHPRRMLAHSAASRSITARRPTVSAFFKSPPSLASSKSSLSTSFLDTTTTSCNEFTGQKIRPVILYPASIKRNVITNVIPFQRGSAWKQPPPDLASYLFRGRIVYLGMSLIPAVTELLMAEFIYLQYESQTKPIFMYINSTGTTKGDRKVGYETEAFAIYDAMKFIKPPIFTLCVGNAWGEAALLLAAGSKGNRAALPSSTIMIKQPIGRFRGQASAVDAARKEIRRVKQDMVRLYAKNMNKTEEQIEADIRRPKYFSPSEAVEYGIIDKVLYTENNPTDQGVFSDLKKDNLISSP